MNFDIFANMTVLVAPNVFSIVLISLAYSNTEVTLEARYSKLWKTFYQNLLKRVTKGTPTPEQTVILQSKDEAHWMTLAFVNSAYLLLSIFFSFFMLASLAPGM